MHKNDNYKPRNDIYGESSGGGSITPDQFFTMLYQQLLPGANITFDIHGETKTITINAITNASDVINIITNLYTAGNNITFRLEDDMIFIDANDTKVLASADDTIPSTLINKITGDNVTVNLIESAGPFGKQLVLKAIPEGIITEAELGLQPISLESITTSIDCDGTAPIYKQSMFMNYNTRINAISMYCFQSGNIPLGARICICDENNVVLACSAEINYVPQGFVEYPLYGANENAGPYTLTILKKSLIKFCIGYKQGSQDPKWLGTNLESLTGSAGEEIASADLNNYSAIPGTHAANLVGYTLNTGSRTEQGGRRFWFAGYML